jgi:RNA-binding protein 39
LNISPPPCRTPEETEEEKQKKKEAAEREANRDDYAVFVEQIHPKIDEKDLFEFFSHVGRVEDIRLIRDQRTQKSKGLCYVEFWDKESVGKATTLTGQLLGGYPITISVTQSPKQADTVTAASENSVRLYIGDLPENVTDSELKPVFEPFGDIDFIEVHMNDDGTSKCFGFVQFKAESDGRAAAEALNGIEIAGKTIKVGVVDAVPTDNGPVSSMDENGSGGMALNAQSRAALMANLSRGADMPMFPGLGGSVAPPPMPVAPAPVVNVVRIQPSTCIVVKNMFDTATETEADFDLDIKEDVEEEAAKHGKLKHIFVDKNSQGHVYLRYETIAASSALQKTFHGRWFASRQISAEFVVEGTYLARFPEAK